MNYWEREHKEFQKAWDNSKDIKFIVFINYGGGLLEQVVEVRKADPYGDDTDTWHDREGNTSYEKDTTIELNSGHAIKGFDTYKEAKLFLDGGKFFREFISQFFVKRI